MNAELLRSLNCDINIGTLGEFVGYGVYDIPKKGSAKFDFYEK